jgi:hypothetical protein
MNWIFDNSYDSFSLDIGSYIVNRGILLDDITEAVFLVKVNEADADAEAKATLTLGLGLTKVAGATGYEEAEAKMVAGFYATHFDTNHMRVGVKYYMGLGIKTASMTKFLEIKPVNNRLLILNDFIHD